MFVKHWRVIIFKPLCLSECLNILILKTGYLHSNTAYVLQLVVKITEFELKKKRHKTVNMNNGYSKIFIYCIKQQLL